MKSFKIKPPTYVLIAIILVITLHFSLPIMSLIPTPWILLGIVPIIAGLVINISADQTFHRAETPVCPFDAPSALVTYGPYRFTRNPMYLGFVLVLIGVAMLMGSLTPFVIVFALGLLLDRMFINMEEQKLAVEFGAKWEEYKSQTRRWL